MGLIFPVGLKFYKRVYQNRWGPSPPSRRKHTVATYVVEIQLTVVEPRLDTSLSEVCIQVLERVDHVVIVSGGEWSQ